MERVPVLGVGVAQPGLVQGLGSPRGLRFVPWKAAKRDGKVSLLGRALLSAVLCTEYSDGGSWPFRTTVPSGLLLERGKKLPCAKGCGILGQRQSQGPLRDLPRGRAMLL